MRTLPPPLRRYFFIINLKPKEKQMTNTYTKYFYKNFHIHMYIGIYIYICQAQFESNISYVVKKHTTLQIKFEQNIVS